MSAVSCLPLVHHVFLFWSNSDLLWGLDKNETFNCSLTEWPALFSPPVNRYPALFCTTGTHDWPQLGSLNEWHKLKTGFYGKSCPSSSLSDTPSNEAEKSLRLRGIHLQCEFVCTGVCVCVLLCVVGIESYPGLICSHHGALAAGVPIHLWSEHTTSYPGKMLSTRVGLPQGSVDIWAMPGMFLFIKGQHLAIFISAIKHAAVRGKRGSKCEKRLGNDEEREEAVLEFQHLLELYLLPMQQYWPKEWWLLLLRCMVFRSPLIIGQRWPIDDWLIWGFSAAVTSAAFKWMWVKINIWTSIVTLTILNKSNYVLQTQTMEMLNWTHNTVCFLHLTIIFYSSLLWF